MGLSMKSTEQLSDLSVVIATLGGVSLHETLRRLNCGNIRPGEILVCVPKKEAGQIKIAQADNNVKIVITSVRGQVAQRAVGLSVAKGRFVMQMDDDIYLENESLGRLLSSLKKRGRGNIVAPVYKNAADNNSLVHYEFGIKGWLASVEATLLCLAPWGLKRMGKLTSLGIGYGVDPRHVLQDEFEVEWLPGGCVICAKEDLIIDNYYPLAGKAYTEDVVHSILWRQRGCRLWTVVTASCYTEVAPLDINPREILSNFRARTYVAGLLRGNKFRLRVWFTFYLIRRLLSALRVSF